jgi:hypothetical protein
MVRVFSAVGRAIRRLIKRLAGAYLFCRRGRSIRGRGPVSVSLSLAKEGDTAVHKKAGKTKRRILFAVPYTENISVSDPITTFFPLAREAQ